MRAIHNNSNVTYNINKYVMLQLLRKKTYILIDTLCMLQNNI